MSHPYDAVIRRGWPLKSTNGDNEVEVAGFDATPIILDFDDYPLYK